MEEKKYTSSNGRSGWVIAVPDGTGQVLADHTAGAIGVADGLAVWQAVPAAGKTLLIGSDTSPICGGRVLATQTALGGKERNSLLVVEQGAVITCYGYDRRSAVTKVLEGTTLRTATALEVVGAKTAAEAAARPAGTHIINAFSAQMLRGDTDVRFVRAGISALPEGRTYISHVGHADLAKIIGVPMCRDAYNIEPGDEILLAQYTGARLPEGATVLPEGATIVYWWVRATSM